MHIQIQFASTKFPFSEFPKILNTSVLPHMGDSHPVARRLNLIILKESSFGYFVPGGGFQFELELLSQQSIKVVKPTLTLMEPDPRRECVCHGYHTIC
jgi:hypothetical protein